MSGCPIWVFAVDPQNEPCYDLASAQVQDERYKVFLFQALFSALVTASLDAQRIRILSPTYNYPYKLHSQIPQDRRAR